MRQVSLIIIIYNDKFLLFKRSKLNHQFKNMYGLIGGGIEEGETPEEAAIREAKEEINLELTNIKHLKNYKFDGSSLNVFYIAIDSIDNIKLNSEHTGFDAFTLEELSNNPDVIPSTPKMINDYLDKSNLIKELYGSFDGNEDILSDEDDNFSNVKYNGTNVDMSTPVMDESGTDRYTSDYGVGDTKYGVYNVEHDNDNNDNFSNDELLERRTAWINGSKAVSVKQKCRLGGGTICNQGDMNNLEFGKLSLNEEIDASEAYKDEDVVKTVIQGRKGAGMVQLTPAIKDLIIKNNLNVMMVIPPHHDMYVVYKDQRDKALALFYYLKNNGGYLTDHTPEEAWKIGKLLDYSDASIKKIIKQIYVDKKDFFGNDISNRYPKDMVVDPKFIDENNEHNISCEEIKIIPEIAEYVSKFDSSEKLLRSGGIPIELLDKAAYGFSDSDIKQLMPKHLNIKWKADLENVIYEQQKSGLSKIDWAKKIDLSEPIDVTYNGKKFFIEDGHHRYYAAKILNKPLNINLDINANPIKKLDGGIGDYDKFNRCIWNQVHNNYLPEISWDGYQKNGLGLDNYIEEGVGDIYAEKKFGIPNQDTVFDDLYKSSKEKEANEPVAISYGKLKTNDTEKSPIEIYKNPKSLNNFGIDVRAIGDSYGNLYVAVHNGYINHGNIGKALGFGNEVDESPSKYVLLHRIKYSDSFGLSDTSDQDYQTHYADEIINLLKGIKKRNPQYKFFTKYYKEDYMGNNAIEEGVGDKYFEKRTGSKPEFNDFEQKYNEKKIKDNEENVVYSDENLTIIANPKSLKNIGRNVRGIIDNGGNLYVEAQSYTTHDELIKILSKKGLIKHIDDWHLVLPTDFITVVRYGDTNKFFLGESNEMMMPDEDRYENDRKYLGKWYKIPSYMQSYNIFQSFLDRAKQNNPKIEFINEMVRYTFGINEESIINNINEAKKMMKIL